MGPEDSFRNSIHKKLNPLIHHEKMSNPYRRGTPDDYYEKPGGFAWVEYKCYSKIPATLDLRRPEKAPKLSSEQQGWLKRAYENGMPVYVIVGLGPGRGRRGVIFSSPEEWARPWTREELHERGLMSPLDLAILIDRKLIRGVA